MSLAFEPEWDEPMDPLEKAERTIAAQVGTIEHLQGVIDRCVIHLHEAGLHAQADDAEKLAASGF